jgi:hypothetical protein
MGEEARLCDVFAGAMRCHCRVPPSTFTTFEEIATIRIIGGVYFLPRRGP